ncbi:hypothetical protein [Aeromonas dhakensis]|uniref:hypothetical protein n=1 Tax=Aeromonas dhakensis TaxID=196024 RepID=UPI003EC4C8AF
MSNKQNSLNALRRDKNAWFFELSALREPISDRDFIKHIAELYGCDHVETFPLTLVAGGRNVQACRSEAGWAKPSERYRRFYISRKGDFIPPNGYDRLIIVSSLDLQEIYVQRGGRGRQKLVGIAELVRIIGHLAEAGEVKL